MRLLQITDLHLKADPAVLMQGRNIRDSLNAVLRIALGSDTEKPEVIVVSGDISDEEQEPDCTQAYRHLQKSLAGFNGKIRCIPGNHDLPCALYRCFGPETRTNLEVANWQLIFLDSRLKGSLGGILDAAQFKALKASLDSQTAEHTLIFIHHPPIAINSNWLDRIGLQNGAELIALLTQYNSVRGVVFGHAHQEFEAEIAGIRMMGTPATCPRQFLPGADEYRVDPQASPGFRWLTLHPDGTLESQLVRV